MGRARELNVRWDAAYAACAQAQAQLDAVTAEIRANSRAIRVLVSDLPRDADAPGGTIAVGSTNQTPKGETK